MKVYVVNDEDLVSLETVGHGEWDGTTRVVTEADHVAAMTDRGTMFPLSMLEDFSRESYSKGYAAALDAARDAVAALLSDKAPEYLAKWVWPYGPAQMKADALAAIDALKEQA